MGNFSKQEMVGKQGMRFLGNSTMGRLFQFDVQCNHLTTYTHQTKPILKYRIQHSVDNTDERDAGKKSGGTNVLTL